MTAIVSCSFAVIVLSRNFWKRDWGRFSKSCETPFLRRNSMNLIWWERVWCQKVFRVKLELFIPNSTPSLFDFGFRAAPIWEIKSSSYDVHYLHSNARISSVHGTASVAFGLFAYVCDIDSWALRISSATKREHSECRHDEMSSCIRHALEKRSGATWW